MKAELREGERLVLDDVVGMLDPALPESIMAFFEYHEPMCSFLFFPPQVKFKLNFCIATLLPLCLHRPVTLEQTGI